MYIVVYRMFIILCCDYHTCYRTIVYEDCQVRFAGEKRACDHDIATGCTRIQYDFQQFALF